MYLKYKLIDNDYPPVKKYDNDAAYDLSLPHDIHLQPNSITTVDLGIAFDIPEGYYMEIFPRSSLQTKHGIISSTSIIDCDYKGPVHAILYNTTDKNITLYIGTRVVQVMVHKIESIEMIERESISENKRGGLGSTGDY